MLVKFIMCLLMLIYMSKKGFASVPTEEDKQRVYYKKKPEFWEQCKSKISEESLVIFEDDWEADNEEIRAYRFCIAEFYGIVENGKINIDNLLSFSQKNFPFIQPYEMAGARLLVSRCKSLVDQVADGYAMLQEFSKCTRREVSVKMD